MNGLPGSGTLTNQASGLIYSAVTTGPGALCYAPVYFLGGSAYVLNMGRIAVNPTAMSFIQDGVSFPTPAIYVGNTSTSGLILSNTSTGTITGGVFEGATGGVPVTVNNAGVMTSGPSLPDVYIHSTLAVITNTGTMLSSDPAGAIFEFANSGPATIVNLGTIINSAANGVAIQLRGTSITSARIVSNQVSLGVSSYMKGIVDGGTLGNNTLNLLSGASRGTLNATTFKNFGTISFASGGSWTVNTTLATSTATAQTFAGFSAGDTIKLGALAVTGVTASYNSTGHFTNVTLNGLNADQLRFAGSFASSAFAVSGGALTSSVICFLPGTLIDTPYGRIAIERLRVGDLVKTLPSKWLGALHGDRQGQFSIRINLQWRICFEWPDGAEGPSNVEITDYH